MSLPLAADGARPWRWLLGLVALLALVACVVLAASFGEMPIAPLTSLQAIANGLGLGPYPVERIVQGIVWDYRFSRALVAACCGAGLAVCGAILQALLRNALAEPYVLGLSAGASTGAVLVMLLGIGGGAFGVSLGAFFGAMLAFTVVLPFLGRGGSSTRIILAGVAASQLFNALTAYIVATSANAEQARSVMFWLLGSLSGVRWPDVWLAGGVVLGGLLVCLACARALDAFAFGEDAAASLGVAVGPLRFLLLAVTGLITACLVSLVGAVGFVGLVIPHVARFLVGPGHGRLLPTCALIGALFMVLADIVARTLVAKQTLPIGVVTALFGAPAFALILYRARAVR